MQLFLTVEVRKWKQKAKIKTLIAILLWVEWAAVCVKYGKLKCRTVRP